MLFESSLRVRKETRCNAWSSTYANPIPICLHPLCPAGLDSFGSISSIGLSYLECEFIASIEIDGLVGEARLNHFGLEIRERGYHDVVITCDIL